MLHNLFSYGTLRYPQVQQDTFGRQLTHSPDQLIGYRVRLVEITDPAVLASSKEKYHPIVFYTGDKGHKVSGVVMQITEQELLQADSYEVEDYKRVSAKLASGKHAWVYVSALSQSPGNDNG